MSLASGAPLRSFRNTEWLSCDYLFPNLHRRIGPMLGRSAWIR